MKKIFRSTLFPALLAAGCNMESAPTSDAGNREPVDTETVAWESLPEGRNYLITRVDSQGVPTYAPVTFLDTLALIEGDIIVAAGKSKVEALRAELVDPKNPAPRGLAKSSGFVKTSAMLGGANSWPYGRIPYVIAGNVADRARVEQAIYEFNLMGNGVTFVPNQGDAQGVVFLLSYEQVSSSSVGMVAPGQFQPIYLISTATIRSIMHEMGHATGMYHEHVRPDRGTYINITTSGTDQLDFYNRGYAIQNDGTTIGGYDMQSIMHYKNVTEPYTNPDNSIYKVTITSLNGQNTGNDHLSSGDKTTLWNLSVNQYPFYAGSTLSNTAGKVIKPFFTNPSLTLKRWLLTYDIATGNSNVTALNENNTVSNSVQNLFVGSGFNIVLPYNSGSGSPCMLFYSTASGQVKLYNVMEGAGALNPTPIASGYWNSGWATIETYEHGSNRFWFFQNASSQAVNIWSINNAGGLGSLTYNATWSGWNYFKPFYMETSGTTLTPYFLLRYGTTKYRIRELTASGTLASTWIDRNLASYTPVGMWQSVGKAYLALATGSAILIYDFDQNGFRADGSVFRAANLGRGVNKIETTSFLKSYNNGSAPVGNKWFDFKHIAIMNWSTISNYAYTGSMAPFH